MSFGGSFQTGPDSLYAGADLARRNEEANLRMQELRRMEEARRQLAEDELLKKDIPDVRASWASGMTDVVNAPAPARPPAPAPLNLPPQQQHVVGRVDEPAPGTSSVRRMTPEEVTRLQQRQAGTLPVTEMSAAEFQSLPPAQRLQYLQKLNAERQARIDRANLLKAPAAAADIPAAFYQGATSLIDMGANAIGIPRLGRALGIYEPDVTRVEIPKFSSMTPTTTSFVGLKLRTNR